MIDNFSGIDTEGGDIMVCHRRHAVIILLFLKDRSSLQYFITQGMGQSSMFLTFRTLYNLGGGLGLWVGWEEGEEESQGSMSAYYEACLKT